MEKIKRIMEKLMGRIIKGYTLFDTPSLLNKLCEKYPEKRWLLWLIWQIKEYSIYALWVYILWFIGQFCLPDIICKECYDIIRIPINQSMVFP